MSEQGWHWLSAAGAEASEDTVLQGQVGIPEMKLHVGLGLCVVLSSLMLLHTRQLFLFLTEAAEKTGLWYTLRMTSAHKCRDARPRPVL